MATDLQEVHWAGVVSNWSLRENLTNGGLLCWLRRCCTYYFGQR